MDEATDGLTAAGDGRAGRRDRLRSFFALDDDWVRVPAPDAARKDALLTVAFLAVSAFGLELARSAGMLGSHPVWGEYLGLVAMAAPILVRRRWPVVAGIVSSLAFFVVGLTMPTVAVQLSVQALYFFALFSAMAWARSRGTVLLATGGILLLMFGWLTAQYAIGSSIDEIRRQTGAATGAMLGPIAATIVYSFLINVVYFGGAVIGGQVAWRAARSRARLAEQAARLESQAARLREAAVVEERLRIARELHDVVAHHVSVMGVQAAGARRVLDHDPAAASTALGAVETSAREAVSEMRSLLGTLRGSTATSGCAGSAGSGAADRSPEPGIDALGALVEQLRAPELDVAWTVVESEPGALATVSPAAGLTLYRTVQEAVSNVRRHSTARRAAVVLRVDKTSAGGFAEVEVVDDGRPRTGTSGSGLGLLGMRERVASLDGVIEVGPRVTGGYRVRVRLPLTRHVREDTP